MKRIWVAIFGLIMVCLAVFVAVNTKPFIVSFVQKELKSIFVGSKVTIQKCDLDIFHRLSFSDIEIRKGNDYRIKIKKVTCAYRPWALFTHRLRGSLVVESAQFNKIKVQDIRLKFRLVRKELFIEGIKGEFLNGTFQGTAKVNISQPPEYFIALKIMNLDLVRVTKDFELKEKVQASGLLSGPLYVRGRGQDLLALNGDLTATKDGGNVDITDTKFLERFAQDSKQPLNIVVDSLKNYHYSNGIVRLGLDKDNLNLNIDLGGEAGKRNFNITLHDINKR